MATGKGSILDFFLIGIFGLCSFAMLFQSYRATLPYSAYLAILALSIIAISVSISLRKELVAIVGIFCFSTTIRLMYFVATDFAVFPYGDAYSQYSVLLGFSQSSHISILKGSSFLDFLTRIPHQYSEWPGLQAFALTLSRITNLPIFWIAQIFPFILYAMWFVVSYAILRKLFSRFAVPASIFATVSMAVATGSPIFEMPPIFKYDFMATVLLVAFILLLIYPLNVQILEKSLLFVILVSTIIVTHSLTSLFLLMVIMLVGLAFVFRAFAPKFVERFEWARLIPRTQKIRISFGRLFLLVLALVGTWWLYYATSMKVYVYKLSYLAKSFSFQFLSSSRGAGVRKAMGVGAITPSWLLELLHYRDELLLVMVGLGAVVLIVNLMVRPLFLRKQPLISWVLLSIAVVVFVTEAFKTLNYGDRAFQSFAPFLGCFVAIPLAAIAARRPNLGKIGAILIMIFFLFTVGLGFWGSSYAPSFLYSSKTSAYSFGDHPTNWQQVASYLGNTVDSNSTSPACVLTNEVYVTSLAVPLQTLKITYAYTDIRPRAGCIAIIYDTLTHFNSSTYIGEPYNPYPANANSPAFSNAAFSSVLDNSSDLVFDGGNSTIYYIN